MKTQAEMMEYFASMPKKERKNPYWEFNTDLNRPVSIRKPEIPLTVETSKTLLTKVRQYFRHMYRSFHTEAQVLCVTALDAQKLEVNGIPQLGSETWGLFGQPVKIFVLPQQNTIGNSQIDEAFWQEMIIENQIVPVARIHSHHILEAYQSSTDYSTLNSNSLEMVMGRIEDHLFQVAFWLDQHGTDTKSVVIRETEMEDGHFDTVQIPCGGQRVRKN